MSLINMAAAIRPLQPMSPQGALSLGAGLQAAKSRREEVATYGPGGAQRFAQMIGKAADWADTPEKWAQAQSYLTQQGIPNVDQFGYEQRDMIRAFYGRAPAERTALEQHMATVEQMVQSGRLTPEQGQQAVLSKLGISPSGGDATDDMREYNFARQSGFSGTFQEWMDRNREPASRDTAKGADGYLYYTDTGERVLPSVEKPREPTQFVVTGDRASEYGLDPAGSYNIEIGPNGVSASRIGGGGTTINLGTGDPRWGEAPTDHVWLRGADGEVVTEATPDGRGVRPVAVPISGTKAATDAARAAGTEAVRDENVQRAGAVVLGDIQKAYDGASAWNTGLLGSATSIIPGTPAHDLYQTLQTIRANVGFDRLQQMRDASPTGGALGAVNQSEMGLLTSALGALEQSQSKEQFQSNLDRLGRIYMDIIHGSGNWSEDDITWGRAAAGGTFVVDGVTVTRK